VSKRTAVKALDVLRREGLTRTVAGVGHVRGRTGLTRARAGTRLAHREFRPLAPSLAALSLMNPLACAVCAAVLRFRRLSCAASESKCDLWDLQ
jgi:hypothetical protein